LLEALDFDPHVVGGAIVDDDDLVDLERVHTLPNGLRFVMPCHDRPTSPTSIGVPRATLTAFSKARSRLTYQCRHQPSTNWSSISGSPRPQNRCAARLLAYADQEIE
jgi:hypothetical protein